MPQEVDDIMAKLNTTVHSTRALSYEWPKESPRALSKKPHEANPSSRFTINLQSPSHKEPQHIESLGRTCLSNDTTQLQRVPAQKKLVLLGAAASPDVEPSLKDPDPEPERRPTSS